MTFSQQLISPTLLYLGNPEDLRHGVGDIFARKVMQIPNLETVFESERLFFPEILSNLTCCGVILVKYARGQSCCHGDLQCNDNFKIFIDDPKRELFGPKV